MNWRRIGISLAIYGIGSLSGLVFIVLFSKNATPNFILPFGGFFLPAVGVLRGRRGERTSASTQLVGTAGCVLISLATYGVNLFWPERLPNPHVGLIGVLLAIVIEYPVSWMTDRVFARLFGARANAVSRVQ